MKVKCIDKNMWTVFPKDKELEVSFERQIIGEKYYKFECSKGLHHHSDFEQINGG